MASSSHPVVFRDVVKRFARGNYYDSLRDVLTRLASLGRRGRKPDWFNAVDGLSFEVDHGEALGIVGPNGCGKSTTLKLLTGIYVATSGTIHVEGRVAPLIEVGAGFHPDLSGRENIYLNGSISGMSRAEIDVHFDEIVAFSGLERFLDTPVKRYSSGMYMRLGFSIAAHVPSDVLVVDEVLAVGDVGFRARCIERMHELKRSGRTILFVSHSPYQVRSLCDRVIYMKAGQKVFDGDPVEGTALYERESRLGTEEHKFEEVDRADQAAARLLRTDVHADSMGDEVPSIAPGGGLSVVVEYELLEDREASPVLSVGLLRSDGVLACVLNSREHDFVLPRTRGRHVVRATLHDLPLYPWDFSVEVLLWDAEMVVVLDQRSAGGLSVDVEAHRRINRPGVFSPEGGFEAVGPA